VEANADPVIATETHQAAKGLPSYVGHPSTTTDVALLEAFISAVPVARAFHEATSAGAQRGTVQA